MSLGQVRTALAGAMSGLGFTTYAVLPGSPELPAAVVGFPSSIQYHQTLAGGAEYTFPVTLIAPWTDEESAQQLIDTAVSYGATGSVVSALESATGTYWDSLYVASASNFQPMTIGEARAVAVDLTVVVTA